jgi:hypothetical protein
MPYASIIYGIKVNQELCNQYNNYKYYVILNKKMPKHLSKIICDYLSSDDWFNEYKLEIFQSMLSKLVGVKHPIEIKYIDFAHTTSELEEDDDCYLVGIKCYHVDAQYCGCLEIKPINNEILTNMKIFIDQNKQLRYDQLKSYVLVDSQNY